MPTPLKEQDLKRLKPGDKLIIIDHRLERFKGKVATITYVYGRYDSGAPLIGVKLQNGIERQFYYWRFAFYYEDWFDIWVR